MERIQSPTRPREHAEAPGCVLCDAELEGPRCGHCGAAVAPGGYRVQRLLSQSPHGRVYLAVDGDGRKVALKELLFAMVPGVEQLDAFEREAAVLRSLSHPDIPRFVASFREGSGVGTRLYLAQELVEGESLLQRLARRRLDEEEAWTLAEQVLQTLDALHRRTPALLHRDVKPANLILRPEGRAALVDFGSARHLSRDVTHGSTLVGTFGYMPPEQLGGTVEPSSDLYALGATLVHALTGREPAELVDDGLVLSFEAHLSEGSEGLRGFLRKLLAPRRADRFSSAKAALSALRAARAAPASPGRGSQVLAPARGGASSAPGGEEAPSPVDPRVSGSEASSTRAVEGAQTPAGLTVASPPVAVGHPAPALESTQGAAERAVPASEVHRERAASTRGLTEDGSSSEKPTPVASPRTGEGDQQGSSEVAPVSAHRKRLRRALLALSVTALLLGLLRMLGGMGGRVVVEDSPGWNNAPEQAAPRTHPASPGPGGARPRFRTPWPGESSSPQ
ncbi:protein kinase [Myxococcus stipitatus]|uniref:serine/threonine protein kinase n=1 Tax=Myxococcus stipitatus TaxID=83455 RepID=UPI001F355085|nr:serine/threonine-protein kinase [Myxococcus stipitatus]MCE9672040.1 protein kinase [Myxococcus stipitatus]